MIIKTFIGWEKKADFFHQNSFYSHSVFKIPRQRRGIQLVVCKKKRENKMNEIVKIMKIMRV